MRLVVADTGPLNYLILIGAIDLLPKLFERIFIPAVYAMNFHTQKPQRRYVVGSIRVPPGLKFDRTPMMPPTIPMKPLWMKVSVLLSRSPLPSEPILFLWMTVPESRWHTASAWP